MFWYAFSMRCHHQQRAVLENVVTDTLPCVYLKKGGQEDPINTSRFIGPGGYRQWWPCWEGSVPLSLLFVQRIKTPQNHLQD